MNAYQEQAATFAAIARRLREAVLESYRADTCILTAGALIDLLRGEGYQAAPFVVKVVVMNDALVNAIEREGHFPADKAESAEWHRRWGSHSIGVGYGKMPGAKAGWNGHLVAIVAMHSGKPFEPDYWLIDASLDQVDRPEHRIKAGIVVGLVPADFIFGEVQAIVPLALGRAIYTPQPLDRSYERTGAWRDINARTRAIARAVALQKG